MTLVFFRALAAENLHVYDCAFDTRRAIEGRVANISGFFAEDSAKKFFFRGESGFALGRNLADQDVSRADGGADADDAALIEIAKECFADIGNIARDF
jgi:hypothetical protein